MRRNFVEGKEIDSTRQLQPTASVSTLKIFVSNNNVQKYYPLILITREFSFTDLLRQTNKYVVINIIII